jgi:class 3 adenylate cyclase
MRTPPRRLTVLAYVDIAGDTCLLEADERARWRSLATIRSKVMRPTISAHNGNLLKTMSGGALIEFASVEDSVRWAIEFQTAMRERNATREAPILARCGIALADVNIESEDASAARSAPRPRPGGCAAGGRRDHTFRPLAPRQGPGGTVLPHRDRAP